MKKHWIVAALVVFLLTAAIGVIVNGMIGQQFSMARPWLMGNSISWYVGNQTLTAVIFALGNGVVAGLLAGYLWRLGEEWQMPKVYYYLVMTMAVAFLWLLVCPVTMLDTGEKAVITVFHEIASRTMFIMMMLIMAMIALSRKSDQTTKTAAVLYIVYALVSAVAYLGRAGWFMQAMLIWETLYIVLFMGVIMIAKQKEAI